MAQFRGIGSSRSSGRPISPLRWVERLRRPRRIKTVAELMAVSRGSIVRSKAQTIACRLDAERGVIFGNENPFPWGNLKLPCELLWTPGTRW